MHLVRDVFGHCLTISVSLEEREAVCDSGSEEGAIYHRNPVSEV
jgi:hypothetical protein